MVNVNAKFTRCTHTIESILFHFQLIPGTIVAGYKVLLQPVPFAATHFNKIAITLFVVGDACVVMQYWYTDMRIVDSIFLLWSAFVSLVVEVLLLYSVRKLNCFHQGTARLIEQLSHESEPPRDRMAALPTSPYPQSRSQFTPNVEMVLRRMKLLCIFMTPVALVAVGLQIQTAVSAMERSTREDASDSNPDDASGVLILIPLRTTQVLYEFVVLWYSWLPLEFAMCMKPQETEAGAATATEPPAEETQKSPKSSRTATRYERY